MKNASTTILKNHRPNLATKDAVEFCLHRLFVDKKHHTSEQVVFGLTYEELIGALLLALDDANEANEEG